MAATFHAQRDEQEDRRRLGRAGERSLFFPHTGLSVHPSYGGPIYLIRNELFGITALPFKLYNYCTSMVWSNTTQAAAPGMD
jgi:hypothetical protein